MDNIFTDLKVIVPVAMSLLTGLIGLLNFFFILGKRAGKAENPGEIRIKDYKDRAELAERDRDEALARSSKQSADLRRYQSLKTALIGGDKALWNSHGAVPFPDYDRLINSHDLHVLTVMNLKGGVGKTTLATNLAAHFEISLLPTRRLVLLKAKQMRLNC